MTSADGTRIAYDRQGDGPAVVLVTGGLDDGGASEGNIDEARKAPVWPTLEAIAHTLAYDAACLGGGEPPTARLARVAQPALVVTGGRDEFFERAGDAIADRLRRAERRRLEGQGHVVDPKAFAPVLARFLAAAR